jgi:hypothetical protein
MSQTRAQLISDLVQALAFASTSDAPQTGVFCGAENEVAVATQSIARLTVDGSGRVMIGTTSAFGGNNEMLQVARNGGGAIALLRNDTSVSSGNELGAISWYGNDSTATTHQECATIRAFADGDHGDDDKPTRLVFSTTADGGDSPTERMRIQSDGTVKIGTGSGNPILMLNASTSGTSVIQMGDSDDNNIGQIQYANNDDAMLFFANNAERLRIDSSGRVGIGTSSPNAVLTTDPASGNFNATYNDYDGVGLFIRGNGTSSNGNYGPALAFGSCDSDTLNQENKHCAISIVQTDVDPNQTGLAFWTHPSNTSTDALVEKLRIEADGNVGIGTTSPGCQTGGIHAVHDATQGTPSFTGAEVGIFQRNFNGAQDCAVSIVSGTNASSIINFGDKDDVNPGIIEYLNGSNAMRFSTDAGERMRIDSSGFVGIGTTSPTDHNSFTRIVDINGSGGGALYCRTNGSSTNVGIFGQSGSDVYVINKASGNIRFNVADAEKMRIDSSGRIGIGETTMDGLLVIKGDSDDASTPSIRLKDGTDTREAWISNSAGDLVLVNGGDDNTPHCKITLFDGNIMTFATANTERMRISSNGHLSVGTTTDNPGDGNTTAGTSFNANGKYFISCSADGGHINRNNDGAIMHCRRSGSLVGSITVSSSATSFNENSDYRLKENIVDITDGITRLKQLQPRRFNFIVDPENTVDGFIAHEAQAVVPQAVTGTHNEVDDDGNPVMQQIDKSKLVPLLTAALQEAIAKIETLETKVAALEAE